MLVTRPAHQAEAFCQLLQRAGCEPLRCPTVEIAPPADPARVRDELAALRDAAVAVFTSANAAHFAHRAAPLPQCLGAATTVLAVGPATAAALAQCGVCAQYPEHDHSSRGLLAMPALAAAAGKAVHLVRGAGGLALLPDRLRAVGAQLRIIEAYRRHLPDNASLLQQILHTGLPQIISTTSNESLSNLVTLTAVEERPRLWHIPILVNSERGERLARSLGFCGDVLRASPAGDHGQISTLKAWITQRLTQR